MSKKTQQSSEKAVPVPLWPDADLEDLLALAGQKYALEFETISAGGRELHILQVADMRERLDRAIAGNRLADALNSLPLWAKIWPASLILGHMLRHVPDRNLTILEVGAGCGVAGLVAAALGLGKVCISDIDEDALLFARINILKNGLGHCAEVRRVDVERDALEERFSLLIGAEILYLDHLYRPLVKFFKRHLAAQAPGIEGQPSFEPQVLLASDHRRKAEPFLKRAEKEFRISRRQVGAKQSQGHEAGSGAERHLINLYRLTR